MYCMQYGIQGDTEIIIRRSNIERTHKKKIF